MELSDSGSEKYWYLYQDNHYVGPYSSEQVRSKIHLGQADPKGFAWSEGMKDWVPLREIDIFDAADLPEFTESIFVNQTYDWAPSTGNYELPQFAPSMPAAQPASEADAPMAPVVPAETAAPKNGKYRLAAAVALLSVIATAVLFVYPRHSLPVLADISREDDLSLRSAQSRSFFSSERIAAIALSTANATRPFFYVATNLRNGTKLDVLIEGKSDTLINSLHVSTLATVSVEDGFLRTPNFQKEDGSPFPLGEYEVSVFCRNCSADVATDHSLLTRKTFFIGGARDLDYDQKLKTYHEKLLRQSQKELAEIKQITETLENQLTENATQFEAVLSSGGRSIASGNATWKRFHDQWSRLESQLDAMAKSWTEFSLTDELFYGDVFRLLKQGIDLLRHVHTEQTTYIASGIEDAQIETRISSDTAVVQSVLLSIRTKTALIDRLPVLANGMPQRLQAR